MHRLTLILCTILLGLAGSSQVIFKTEVPRLPVTVGEAFPVQYILEDLEKADGFTPPPFTGFRLVRGPDIYRGSRETAAGKKYIKTIFYTLVGNRPGKFTIRGATAVIDGTEIKSDDVQLEVVNAPVTDKTNKGEQGSAYFLQPGEDPYQKMKENLFMKVQVDRKDCYVGQPVMATFKLYSRLQSKSDIVKNPGFYGFTVQDMVGLNDHVSASETINGKKFDVHTVRTVQLYPLQAGTFSIDPMEVTNRVEFSKSEVNKNPEQVIVEGYFEDEPPKKIDANTLVYENSISTESISINVKPYPSRNKPEGFVGATGKFLIDAIVEHDSIRNNEQGELLVIVEGKGNFPQLTPPVISWPDGIDGFDATIADTLDKSRSPLSGKRVFRFPFVASKKGEYIIKAISFSYFDTDSNSYKTISTDPVRVSIIDSASVTEKAVQPGAGNTRRDGDLWWIVAAIVVVSVVSLAWIMYVRKQKKHKKAQADETKPAPVVAADYLQPAELAMKINAPQFYSTLQRGIWEFLGTTLQLSGSRMNKRELKAAMIRGNFSAEEADEILDILGECETATFTTAELSENKQQLFDRAVKALSATS